MQHTTIKRVHVYGYSRVADIIPVEKLEHGRLYRSDGRSGYLGVWDAVKKEVVFARFKFHPPKYLWPEPHWDTDKHHGTAQPYLALDEWAPEGWDKREVRGECTYLYDEVLLPWLEAMEDKYKEPESPYDIDTGVETCP